MTQRLEDVYDSMARAVTGYFIARGARDPDDLCGDVFERVAARLDGFRGDDAALRRWVFTIAHNRLVDEHRSAARQHELSATAVPDDVDRLDVARMDVDLVEALARLTPEQREVLVLRYVADLSVRDVAAIVGKRPGAVKMLQARGLDELRTELGTSPPSA